MNNIKDDSGFWSFALMLLCLITFLIGVWSGVNNGERRIKLQAVAAGQAHWTVDSKGDTEFHWNNEKP